MPKLSPRSVTATPAGRDGTPCRPPGERREAAGALDAAPTPPAASQRSPRTARSAVPTRVASDSKPVALAEVQRLMAEAVMRPLRRDDGMQTAWKDGSPAAEVAARIIKPNDRLSSFERLQIYNQQYWWRLLGTFGEDFPALRAVVGARKFDRLAVAYLDAYGSQRWTMRDLGQHLESFLRAHPELTAPHERLALDIVRVEWARVIAFDEPAEPVLAPKKIATVAADRLRIGLQPYLTLLALAHPVDDLLRKFKESQIETGAFSNAVAAGGTRARRRIAARPSREPIHLAVHRLDLAVYYKRLDPEAYRLLTALRDGAPLADACETAFAGSKDLPAANAEKIQRWFAQWMEFGWLCRAR